MLKRTLSSSYRLGIGVLAAAVAFSVSAQDGQKKELSSKDAADAALTADLVKTGLYLITGGGGNSLLRFSANGLILVDGKLPRNYRALMTQVRKISKMSDMPVRVLVVTNHHENHAGSNAQFLAAGIPIVVQDNANNNLHAFSPVDERIATPTVTFDREYALRMGGVEVWLKHFGNAHTNGDTVVYFPDLKVVAVGDLFTPGTPEPDFSGGGSLVDWGLVLTQVLKLDFDVVVPSTGPPVTRTDLEAFKNRIDTLVSRAHALVKDGVTKDQLMAQLKTDDLGWRFSFTGSQLDSFYGELSQY
jgi:cyclase